MELTTKGGLAMLEDTKLWLGYITIFILVNFFVVGLLQLTEGSGLQSI
jgi:hypothetical protein